MQYREKCFYFSFSSAFSKPCEAKSKEAASPMEINFPAHKCSRCFILSHLVILLDCTPSGALPSGAVDTDWSIAEPASPLRDYGGYAETPAPLLN